MTDTAERVEPEAAPDPDALRAAEIARQVRVFGVAHVLDDQHVIAAHRIVTHTAVPDSDGPRDVVGRLLAEVREALTPPGVVSGAYDYHAADALAACLRGLHRAGYGILAPPSVPSLRTLLDQLAVPSRTSSPWASTAAGMLPEPGADQ